MKPERCWRVRRENHQIKLKQTKLQFLPPTEKGKAIRWKERRAWPWSCVPWKSWLMLANLASFPNSVFLVLGPMARPSISGCFDCHKAGGSFSRIAPQGVKRGALPVTSDPHLHTKVLLHLQSPAGHLFPLLSPSDKFDFCPVWVWLSLAGNIIPILLESCSLTTSFGLWGSKTRRDVG